MSNHMSIFRADLPGKRHPALWIPFLEDADVFMPCLRDPQKLQIEARQALGLSPESAVSEGLADSEKLADVEEPDDERRHNPDQ